MEEFKIKAYNPSRVGLGITFLILLLIISITALVKTEYIDGFSIFLTFVFLGFVFMYIKRFFFTSLVLELFDDKFRILKEGQVQEIYFKEIRSYKVDWVNGISVHILLKSNEKIKLIVNDNFGDSKSLEDFYKSFLDQIESFQNETLINIEREKSFLESKAGLYFIITLSVLSFGAIRGCFDLNG